MASCRAAVEQRRVGSLGAPTRRAKANAKAEAQRVSGGLVAPKRSEGGSREASPASDLHWHLACSGWRVEFTLIMLMAVRNHQRDEK
jgi:hypothetical protein